VVANQSQHLIRNVMRSTPVAFRVRPVFKDVFTGLFYKTSSLQSGKAVLDRIENGPASLGADVKAEKLHGDRKVVAYATGC
jgi:hypothetical protein